MYSETFIQNLNKKKLKSLKLNYRNISKNLESLGYNINDKNLSHHYIICSNNFYFKNILELGTGSGEFTFFLSNRFKNSNILTIDNYINPKDLSYKNRDIFKKRKKLKIKNIIFLKEDTSIIKNFKKKYDFIFVDADHRFPNVNKDIINSLNILRKNGIMLVDDIIMEDISTNFASKSSYVFLEYLKSQKKIKVDYIFKRIKKGAYTKYIAYVKNR